MDGKISGSRITSRLGAEDVQNELSSDSDPWDPHEWASCVISETQLKGRNVSIPPYWVAPTPSLASAKPTRMQKSITPSTTPTLTYTSPSRTVSREWASERSGPSAPQERSDRKTSHCLSVTSWKMQQKTTDSIHQTSAWRPWERSQPTLLKKTAFVLFLPYPLVGC